VTEPVHIGSPVGGYIVKGLAPLSRARFAFGLVVFVGFTTKNLNLFKGLLERKMAIVLVVIAVPENAILRIVSRPPRVVIFTSYVAWGGLMLVEFVKDLLERLAGGSGSLLPIFLRI